eukprot:GHVU01064930.1.p1 GENE.GHVU01064930.1~~GHVU01064930.1.p1  ORF type:complete len:516 (-),score=63.40 GHVU01064930.1:598-2145(-)
MAKLLVLMLLGITIQSGVGQHGAHIQLIKDKLENYTVFVRPAANYSDPTIVDIDVVLHQILDIDVPDQLMTSYIYVHMYWKDCFLTWNPTDYEGIKSIQLPASKIWRPDIAIYNSVNELKTPVEMLLSRESVVDVTHNGRIWWSVPLLLTSNCPLNIDNFPFDRQACALQFGSWIHTTDNIIVRNKTSTAYGDRPDFIENGEWKIIGAPCTTRNITYDCCDKAHSDVICMVMIDRVPLFYIYTFLFPCLLLSLVAIFVFLLPPESGEKATLSVTLLLAYILALQVIMTYLPTSATSIPIIEHYMGALCCLLSMSTVLSTLIINFHNSIDSNRPPLWMRKMTGCMATILGMHRVTNVLDNYVTQGYYGNATDQVETAFDGKANPDTQSEPMYSTVNILHLHKGSKLLRGESRRALYVNAKKDEPPSAGKETVNLLKELLHEVRSYTKHYSDDDQDGVVDPVKEWVMLARVLDRMLLWVYLLLIVIITVTMLLIAVTSNSPFSDEWMESRKTTGPDY